LHETRLRNGKKTAPSIILAQYVLPSP
jgi:hypothetical protein